jgi:hypothetical protein
MPVPLRLSATTLFIMDKVLLAVYGIRIYRKGDSQRPSDFGNSNDLLKIFNDFALDIIKLTRKPKNGKRSYIFTCAENTLPTLDEATREVSGFFHSGRDGDSYDVGEYDEQGKVKSRTRVTKTMHSTRDSFFYLKVPKELGKKLAYIVLQRTDGQGIKDLLMGQFREYMRNRGLQDYRLVVTNLVPDKVFTNMMDNGLFKQLTLTRHGIPKNIEALKNQEERVPIEKGSIKTIYQAYNLGTDYKEKALQWFGATRESKPKHSDLRVVVELEGKKEAYDEVSMLVELEGKKKTFHLASSSRTQPDMDVTSNVKHDPKTGRLRLDQLLDQARELVSDVTLEIKPGEIDPDVTAS